MSASTPELHGRKAAQHAEAGLSRGLKRYVYFTATMTGAAIMVVEILGARMLSPFMGTSHFAWTAQIAVTLVALACGYYVGGRLADRSPHLARLYWAILIAAVYLSFTVLVIEPVAYWCLDYNLVAGSLLASTILFFFPLGLLAMTGPFLVRMITASVLNVGGNVGRLTALGTIGSFLGTVFVGYFVIPLLPNSVTMYLTAGTLAAIALAYFVFVRRKGIVGALVLCGLVAFPAILAPRGVHHDYTQVDEKFRGNSHFGLLQVIDSPNGSIRYYLNDNLVQNTFDPRTGQSVSVFTYMLSGMAETYTTNIQDVLCIGMGIGIVPMHFARLGAAVDVVEINPEVVPLAEKWFGFDSSAVNVVINDGRHFLNRTRKQYDAVVLDAFLGDSSPSHLMTREAFLSIKRVLRPGGALVINMFGDLEPGKDFFAASLEKTLRAVFPGVRLHGTGDGAIFFTATPRPNPEFVRSLNLEDVHPAVREDYRVTMTSSIRTNPESGRVLTDDYNPVDFYDAKNRETARRRLALAWKDL
jgi:spermidine synthase